MMSSARALPFPGRHLIALSLLTLAAACGRDATGLVAPTTSDMDAPDAPAASLAIVTYSNPIAGATFWADPYSNAAKTAASWRVTAPANAAQMDKVAQQGTAKWFGNWNTSIQSDVSTAVTNMSANGAVPLLVAYNIPQRDCGGLSGGNTTTMAAYKTWITGFANGIGSRRAVVILEPDAIAGFDCLSATDRQMRLDLLNYAVNTLKSKGAVSVYLDGGNPRWKSAGTMAARLINAGVANANGFALNVSNFFFTSDNIAYGTAISNLVGGKHFVIDTGRNGLGPDATANWCNPAGRALGQRPTTLTGNALVDAFLWIKTPGESDGACNGNPSAGTFMPTYALGLAQRAAY